MWPNELIENCITNRYYHSELLGKVAALNIYEKFENCLSQLVKNKLLQVSSDDPNVNTGFLDLFNENRTGAAWIPSTSI